MTKLNPPRITTEPQALWIPGGMQQEEVEKHTDTDEGPTGTTQKEKSEVERTLQRQMDGVQLM